MDLARIASKPSSSVVTAKENIHKSLKPPVQIDVALAKTNLKEETI